MYLYVARIRWDLPPVFKFNCRWISRELYFYLLRRIDHYISSHCPLLYGLVYNRLYDDYYHHYYYYYYTIVYFYLFILLLLSYVISIVVSTADFCMKALKMQSKCNDLSY